MCNQAGRHMDRHMETLNRRRNNRASRPLLPTRPPTDSLRSLPLLSSSLVSSLFVGVKGASLISQSRC